MKILGVKIDSLTKEKALEKISLFLACAKQHQIATINAEFIVDAQKNQKFKKILNSVDLAVCDGFGPFLLSFACGERIKEKIAGVDLIPDICKIAAEKEKKVLFLGGMPKAAKITAEKIKNAMPNIQIFSEENLDLAEKRIKSFEPDILFVAIGHPKQEKWIYNNIAKFPSVKMAMGVGGAFDIIAGFTPRAPRWIRSAGFEWMWRLLLQPRRFKRIFKAVVIFPFLILQNKLQLELRSKNHES